MASSNPNAIDGSSKIAFHWKASNIEFLDGETLQYKLDNNTIGGNSRSNQPQLYNALGSADDGVVTQKKLTAELVDLYNRLTTIEDTVLQVQSRKKITSRPYQRGSLNYTGEIQNANLVYDANAVTLGGTLSGRDAGDYTWTATLKDGYAWADGTSDTVVTGTWSIVPVGSGATDPTPVETPVETNVTLSANKKNVALTKNYTTDNIVYTTNSNGTLEASVEDTDIASVTVNSNTRTVQVKAEKTGTTAVNAQVQASSNYNASSILRIPISVQLENTVALLWDGPVTGTGKGWVRVSGRSTASDIIDITDSNYDQDIWPFNVIEDSNVTINGTSTSCVVFPIMYHRCVKIGKDRILYFIESEKTENNVVMTANNVRTSSGTKAYPLALAKTANKAKKIYAPSETDDWARQGAWLMDIWDLHLLLKLMAIDLNPGKSLNTLPGSWRGLSGLSTTQLVNGFGVGLQSANSLCVGVNTGFYGDPTNKIYSCRGANNSVGGATSFYAGTSISTSWTPHYSTGCWATKKVGNWDLSQLFIELPGDVDSSSSTNYVGYSDFDTNITAAQIAAATRINTAANSTVLTNMKKTNAYAALQMAYANVSVPVTGLSTTFYARLHGWQGL